MTRYEDTPQRRADLIASCPLAPKYPAAQLAVAVMEQPELAVIWDMVRDKSEPFPADLRAEAVADMVYEVFLVATTEKPNATLAKAAMEQMSGDDFVRYCRDRLVDRVSRACPTSYDA